MAETHNLFHTHEKRDATDADAHERSDFLAASQN
jgi:hypothetical protein